MIDSTGAPKVIEYNCRFGDPETQPIMMRLQSDLVELCQAAIAGKLDQVESKWDPRARSVWFSPLAATQATTPKVR